MESGLRIDHMNVLRTDLHAGTAVCAGVFFQHDLMLSHQTFRVRTPLTAERASLEEYDCPDSRSVVHVIFLYIKDQSFSLHAFSPFSFSSSSV